MNRYLKSLFYLVEQFDQIFFMDPMYVFSSFPLLSHTLILLLLLIPIPILFKSNTQNVDENHLDQVIHQLHIDEFTQFMPNGINTYELVHNGCQYAMFHIHSHSQHYWRTRRWYQWRSKASTILKLFSQPIIHYQRIAIARSLLRNPKIIIMDEPTR